MGLHHLLVLVIFLVFTTVGVTFYLSYVKYHHVTYFLPYIGDTGTYPPESCIFGQVLNIVSFLLLFAMYVKYLQITEIYQKHHIEEKFGLNKLTFSSGLLTAVGVSIVANFQETNSYAVQWFGAILTFGGGAVFQCLQTLIYIKISPVLGQRKITLFRIILSIISMVCFITFTATGLIAYGQFQGNDVTKWSREEGGYRMHQISANTEWISAISMMLYILLFYQEFKNISLKPMTVSIEEHKQSTNAVGSA